MTQTQHSAQPKSIAQMNLAAKSMDDIFGVKPKDKEVSNVPKQTPLPKEVPNKDSSKNSAPSQPPLLLSAK